MFKRKHKIEVVPESEYTDYSHRVPGDAYATNKTIIGAASVPITAAIGLSIYHFNTSPTIEHIPTTLPVSAPIIEPTAVLEPIHVLAQAPTIFPTNMASPEMIPTGFIADTSLTMLANVLDPVIQILVAISFPIASVIMVGACFFFMFGNSEKAWNMIMNAGLGYVLIQLSPLFLEILRQVGKAV
ncbi:hypothetical protein PB01_08095 [Psychrobacillus glaciei]|uniref:Uncharacterized protein n=1 Tax=Psychrobacillus glaciei TaxID=2283160 RepID=A0A5J6SLM3_9BACI|nr:hypothetical protein [Psychrobacillus glaciei]QFF98796.1 hypothetical protein PB01_08095 [Psychrobacillus glaciei]